MAKTLRIWLASLTFLGFMLLFFDPSEEAVLAKSLSWLASLQLVPAILAGSFLLVALLLIITALFGRIYCSVLCPLGVLQDIFGACVIWRKYTYSEGHPILRLVFLILFLAAFLLGIPVLFGILEPYSAFGRITTYFGEPITRMAANGVEWIAQSCGVLLLYPQTVIVGSESTLIVAGSTLAILLFFALTRGRIWCTAICPVGTVLGFLSRHALIRPRIKADACVHCGRCASVCKANCIDAKYGTIDASRCLSCWNCSSVCQKDALHFLPAKEKVQGSTVDRDGRRVTLVALASLLAYPVEKVFAAEEHDVAAIQYKERRLHDMPLLPPGALGQTHFSSRCTGCQLCVSACPHSVLRAYDRGKGALQPSMTFEYGYCHTNCVLCGTVCPTGAIRPVSVSQKAKIQVGRAFVLRHTCVVAVDRVSCTACQRVCPTGAIRLVSTEEPKIPFVDTEKCIGCGACEYICPARPFAAIQVKSVEEHRTL